MAEKLMAIEVDCSTGVQTEREFTAKEYADHAKMVEESKQLKIKEEAEAKAKAEALASAQAKLAELGLSDAEVKALIS